MPDKDQEVFNGKGDEYIRILGKATNLSAKNLTVKIEVWDLDKNGNIQRDKRSGNIKVKVISKYIQSIDIWKPKDMDVNVNEK